MKRILLAAVFAFAGCAFAKDFATEMLEATFKLYHENSTGTCFLVRRDGNDKALYLVTAAHVLERTKGPTAILVLRETTKEGSYKRHDYKIDIRHDDKPLWTRHEKDDVAVLRLADAPPVPVATVDMADLADEARLTAAGLHLCSGLFILTYPERFEGNDAGFGVARSGIIASHPFAPVEQHHTFLADFTTFAGDSGGPVFIDAGNNRPLVLGIVLSQFRHDEKVTTEREERTIHHPLGFGAVLHAKFVRDAITAAVDGKSG